MWRDAYKTLRQRLAQVPGLVREAAALEIAALPFDPRGARS
jgi:hypothetical protein